MEYLAAQLPQDNAIDGCLEQLDHALRQVCTCGGASLENSPLAAEHTENSLSFDGEVEYEREDATSRSDMLAPRNFLSSAGRPPPRVNSAASCRASGLLTACRDVSNTSVLGGSYVPLTSSGEASLLPPEPTTPMLIASCAPRTNRRDRTPLAGSHASERQVARTFSSQTVHDSRQHRCATPVIRSRAIRSEMRSTTGSVGSHVNSSRRSSPVPPRPSFVQPRQPLPELPLQQPAIAWHTSPVLQHRATNAAHGRNCFSARPSRDSSRGSTPVMPHPGHFPISPGATPVMPHSGRLSVSPGAPNQSPALRQRRASLSAPPTPATSARSSLVVSPAPQLRALPSAQGLQHTGSVTAPSHAAGPWSHAALPIASPQLAPRLSPTVRLRRPVCRQPAPPMAGSATAPVARAVPVSPALDWRWPTTFPANTSGNFSALSMSANADVDRSVNSSFGVNVGAGGLSLSAIPSCPQSPMGVLRPLTPLEPSKPREHLSALRVYQTTHTPRPSMPTASQRQNFPEGIATVGSIGPMKENQPPQVRAFKEDRIFKPIDTENAQPPRALRQAQWL